MGLWPKEPILKESGKRAIVQEQMLINSRAPRNSSSMSGWERMEIQVLIVKAWNPLKNPKIYLYVTAYFIRGKNP
ncbi:hypothetical protein EDB81DRAFT_628176, partial [Dactylonectria macrodidyma]